MTGRKIRSKKALYEYAKEIWATAIKRNALWRCEWCGEQAREAHHQIAKGKCIALSLDLRNGVALCSACHWEFHRANPGLGSARYASERYDDFLYCQQVYRDLRHGDRVFRKTTEWILENIRLLEAQLKEE